MQLIVLGLNHKTAPVEIRERFNFSQDRTVRVLRRLRNNDNLNEAVLLSTCNRTELYMVLEDPAAGLHFIRTLLRHLAGEQYKPDYFYNLTGINCVRHLFKVASSLDSLIIGEGQILSQIKNAYHLSRSCGMTLCSTPYLIVLSPSASVYVQKQRSPTVLFLFLPPR